MRKALLWVTLLFAIAFVVEPLVAHAAPRLPAAALLLLGISLVLRSLARANARRARQAAASKVTPIRLKA